MKRIISFLCLFSLVILLCGCETEEKKLQPTENFYVNDFANIIDADDESLMLSKAVALNEATTSQVVVVTINSLNGAEASDYALNLGRDWGVGDKEKNNGIVILLSLEEREIYIAVGYGLEGALPDSKTGRIIDRYGLSYLKSDNFSDGLLSINNAIINEVYIEYGIEPEEGYVPIDSLGNIAVYENEPVKVTVSWIILIIILIIFFTITRGRGGPFFFLGFPGYFGGGYRSGGFSGRSGGFGGFSGGGGSFGGGGAGRRF